MTKQLMLLRHGKSDWSADYRSDLGRPLAKRGKKAARAVGVFLVRTGQTPELVLQSPACRARQTLALATKAGGWSCPCRVTHVLYEGGVDAISQEISRLPDTFSNLLLVGHEPVESEFLQWLVGPCHVRFPTATLASISLDCNSWRKLSPGIGQLQWFLPPRLLSRILDTET